MEVTDYQSIKQWATRLGKEEVVRKRAKELQSQLSEGDEVVPFRDAYEMAYNEISESNKSRYF